MSPIQTVSKLPRNNALARCMGVHAAADLTICKSPSTPTEFNFFRNGRIKAICAEQGDAWAACKIDQWLFERVHLVDDNFGNEPGLSPDDIQKKLHDYMFLNSKEKFTNAGTQNDFGVKASPHMSLIRLQYFIATRKVTSGSKNGKRRAK